MSTDVFPSEADRRRTPRADLNYPVRFKLFSRDLTLPQVDGYLKDLSLGGARVGLEDPHGHFRRKSVKGLRTKLQMLLPESETLQLLSVVAWTKPSGPSGTEVEIGLEFVDVERWQQEKLDAFLAIRHTEQTMFWNMWDSYQQAGGRP